MGILNSLKGFIGIFRKKHGAEKQDQFEKEELVYGGYEDVCNACGYPIHRTHRFRKIQGEKMHRDCFRKLARIAFRGESLNEFR